MRHSCATIDSTTFESDNPCLTTSRNSRIGRCAVWATLGSLNDTARAQKIAPLRSLNSSELERRLNAHKGPPVNIGTIGGIFFAGIAAMALIIPRFVASMFKPPSNDTGNFGKKVT